MSRLKECSTKLTFFRFDTGKSINFSSKQRLRDVLAVEELVERMRERAKKKNVIEALQFVYTTMNIDGVARFSILCAASTSTVQTE